MSGPSYTARAIQIDHQAAEVQRQADQVAQTISNPHTCAETHVAQIAERFQAEAEFLKSVADYYGQRGAEED